MPWTHKVEPIEEHPVDPHYQTTGRPAYWVCHECREPILLDGRKPPMTVPATGTTETEEPPMSAQP